MVYTFCSGSSKVMESLCFWYSDPYTILSICLQKCGGVGILCTTIKKENHEARAHNHCIVITKNLNVVNGETSQRLSTFCFCIAFSTWLLKSFLAFFLFSLHSPLFKDTTEANENWLEDSPRHSKQPLHPIPIPSNFHFYFRHRHFRDMGIQV